MLKRKELTPKEEGILNFIFDYMDDHHGVQPSYREMASRLGVDVKQIGDHLAAMEKRGAIKRTGKSRYLMILPDRGVPTFSRSAISSHILRRSPINIGDPIGLTHFRKLVISLGTSDLLNKWLREFKMDENIPIPVPVDLIAKDIFNYDIEKDFLEHGIPGKLFDKEKLIVVNTEDTPQRQRFTIGHELGHLNLQMDEDFAGTLQMIELEADYFAISLLMPLKPFSKYVVKFLNEEKPKREDDLIDKVSKQFDVSREAAKIRLLEFNYLPINANQRSLGLRSMVRSQEKTIHSR